MNELMTVPFEIKELNTDGQFVGVASPYGNKDLGNDVVERGAFTKTLAERGHKVRLLDSHKLRIGLAEVSDSEAGLQAKGTINLDKQTGRDVYSDLKFYQEHKMPMGLSIGYQTVKSDFVGNVRHLKELKLFEVSVTEIPMNESALVTGVKDTRAAVELCEAARISEAELKAGRSMKPEHRATLEAAVKEFQALLDGAAENAGTPAAAASKETEPEALHSAVESLKKLRELIPA